MESLETAALFPDDLFDFSSDIGDGDEEYDANKPFSSYSSSSSAAALNSNLANVNTQQKQQQHKHHQVQKQEVLDIFDSDNYPSVPEFLEEEEEELEWLNEDAFPSIESLDDILPMRLKEETKLQSPTSVLENGSNSNGNSSSSNGSGCIMTCCGSLRVPVRARSRRRRRKRRSFSDIRGQQLWWCELKSKSSTAGATTPATIGRKCWHCFAEKTPQWRAGPFGPKTLCNACGVRYKSGRLVPEYRPASSPSFSTELHSNSHRKILEMRRHRQKEMVLESFDKG